MLTNSKTTENKMMSVHIIGNENVALIVSSLGHFDFRINKRSVFGAVFDPQNRDFVGKSPTFIVSSGGKRMNFSCDRVESTYGSISMISDKIAICFTVDTERRELLAKVIKGASTKEYILCVSGHRIAVNSYNFDQICEKLSKATRYSRFRHRIYTEDGEAQKLYLFACFFDFFDDKRLTCFKSIGDLKRIVSKKRTLCISFPGVFSDKAQSFARSIHNYAGYIKDTFALGVELAFFDPNCSFSKFFDQNRLKKYTEEEFALLRVFSVGTVELAMDFDSKALLNDMIFQSAPSVKAHLRDADNPKVIEFGMGILKSVIGHKTVDSVSFSFKDRAEVLVHSFKMTVKNGGEDIDVLQNARIGSVCENTATYSYTLCGSEDFITVGTDKCLPFLLISFGKIRPCMETSFLFSVDVAGIPVSDKMIRICNTKFATVLTPMLFEKEKVSLFVIKLEDEKALSVVIGAFSGDKDALLYKAAEKYSDSKSVVNELTRQMTGSERYYALVRYFGEEPCHRIRCAINACETDCRIARSYIIWALCFQNIDGSLPCAESAAKALVCYLENSRDKEILRLELPYVYDGKFTSRRENVFMHVMRASECEPKSEDVNALEYLRKVYYQLDQM